MASKNSGHKGRPYLLWLPEDVKSAWEAAARARKLPLSTWIREACAQRLARAQAPRFNLEAQVAALGVDSLLPPEKESAP